MEDLIKEKYKDMTLVMKITRMLIECATYPTFEFWSYNPIPMHGPRPIVPIISGELALLNSPISTNTS